MEISILYSISPILSAILGFAISYFFFKQTITKEVIKEVIKEIPIEVIKEVVKLVEVRKVVNQCQVAEIVTEGDFQHLLGFDYYNRKQVISIKYREGMLNNLKNGDIILYTGQITLAELDFNTISPA